MRKLIELAPGVQIPEPEDGAEVRYSPQAVQNVEDFIGLLCYGQNEWAGRKIELIPWEKNALQQFYGVQVRDDDLIWVRLRRFLYIEIPKKNGKSELAAMLGLYHLLYDGEKVPNVGIFAADKNNADIIYQAAKYMVEHSCLGQPEHDPIAWCRDSRREIHTKYGGVLKVYSADASTKHGYSFSCIIIDELHAQPNRSLWDVLTVGSNAARRQQAVIVLTTAGDDPDQTSIGWEIHEKCRRILAWREGHPERELDDDDPAWCPIMYGISTITGDDPDRIADLNIYDENLWRRCNPSYGVNIKPRDFKADAKAAKQSEAAERNFRWLRLNQWISTKSVGWLPSSLYDKTQWGPSAKAEREIWVEQLKGLKCYGGLDLSTTTDLTAFVLLFPPQKGLDTWVALPQAWRPLDGVEGAEQRDHVPYQDWERAGFIHLCQGDQIDFLEVEEAVAQAARDYKLMALGIDPYLSRTLTQHLTSNDSTKNLEIIEIPQDMKNMSPAMKEMERLIRKHEMLHVHNTCARWNFGNVRCAVDGNENLKPMKNRSIGRIDIIVAWIICVAVALLKEPHGPSSNEHIMDKDWGI